MYVEISKEMFEKLRPHLNQIGAKFEVSDCTLPGEMRAMVHVEILGCLSEEHVRFLNHQIDVLYEESSLNRSAEKAEQPGKCKDVQEVRTRTWDNQMHTPKEEFKGWFTGENEKEEVRYEYRE